MALETGSVVVPFARKHGQTLAGNGIDYAGFASVSPSEQADMHPLAGGGFM